MNYTNLRKHNFEATILVFFITFFLLSCGSDKNEVAGSDSSIQPPKADSFVPPSEFYGMPLFKEYKIGQSYSEFSNSKLYGNCEEEFDENTLCVDGVSFLDIDFGAQLLFEKQKLSSVLLFTEYDEEKLLTIIASMPINDFLPSALTSSNEVVDLIELIQQKGLKITEAKSQEFINIMVDDSESQIEFVEVAGVKNLQKANNFKDVVKLLPKSARMVILNIYINEEGERYINLEFQNFKNVLSGFYKQEKF